MRNREVLELDGPHRPRRSRHREDRNRWPEIGQELSDRLGEERLLPHAGELKGNHVGSEREDQREQLAIGGHL